MKKVLSFIGCAIFVAAMAVSCGQKNQEVVDDSINDTLEGAVEQIAPVEGTIDADHQAMLDAAAEAGRAKCECYKTDAASVESCIKSILTESYAAYEGNEEFQAAMEAEFNNCVKEKATEAAGKAVNEGIKEISKKIAK